jgi:hypothetical protein
VPKTLSYENPALGKTVKSPNKIQIIKDIFITSLY